MNNIPLDDLVLQHCGHAEVSHYPPRTPLQTTWYSSHEPIHFAQDRATSLHPGKRNLIHMVAISILVTNNTIHR